jgi:hypothetical protein
MDEECVPSVSSNRQSIDVSPRGLVTLTSAAQRAQPVPANDVAELAQCSAVGQREFSKILLNLVQSRDLGAQSAFIPEKVPFRATLTLRHCDNVAYRPSIPDGYGLLLHSCLRIQRQQTRRRLVLAVDDPLYIWRRLDLKAGVSCCRMAGPARSGAERINNKLCTLLMGKYICSSPISFQ